MFMRAALVAAEGLGVALLVPVVLGGSLVTGGVTLAGLGCGASEVTFAFVLETVVAEAVAGAGFSVCSAPAVFALCESLLSLSLLPEEGAVRGAMLFPFSAPESELAACVGCAASTGAAEMKSASAVEYRTFFMMHS
jgi:hypothetical protein